MVAIAVVDRPRMVVAPPAGPVLRRPLAGSALALAAVVGVAQLDLAEADFYRLGLVLVAIVAAMGLHILVNWGGELSLAHAALVGAPALLVAKLSAQESLSPVVLLPVGIAAGAALGAVLGLPALRARGLHVTLLSLAFFVAVDRYLFTKEWFAGPPGGYDIESPTLGSIELGSTRSLFVLTGVCTCLAALAAWQLWRSRVARAMLWAQAAPAAASAFGIPVAAHRVAAYALSGAFAGLAGGLTVVLVQRVSPDAFPFQLSFTYLVIVVVAGRGFLGGVVLAAAMFEGGRLFLASTFGGNAIIAYGGPLGLITTLIQYKAGFNGFFRSMAERRRRASR